MKQKIISILLTLLMLVLSLPTEMLADDGKDLRIIFTHDIHSYLEPTMANVNGVIRERGGVSRLATILKKYSNDNSIYLDAGDFSQGTLFQSGFENNAYELSMLGVLGCAATTFGNHEWDHGSDGLANMLYSAMRYASETNILLPKLLVSNIIWPDVNMTYDQLALKSALSDYSQYENYESSIFVINGIKVGVFGIEGPDSIADAPTANLEFENYIDAAKRVVGELEDKCDFIVALSHSGTSGDGETGDDIDLLKEVPGIDFVVSGHSHTSYEKPVHIGESYLGSTGEYLNNVGVVDFKVKNDGTIELVNYELVPCDEKVNEDPTVKALVNSFKESINNSYLLPYNLTFDEVIAYTQFDFIELQEMYATHDEYPLGDLIADSYIYEAKKNGVDDIDVALVGLGTIRGSFFKGPITVSDAFEICSLGVSEDGSAGHPLVTAYITGDELQLLTELDASLGELVSSIKMSYSGLEYSFNTSRVLLDRATAPRLVKDGRFEEINKTKLYKVCCNMYAANMLGMLNGLTRGVLTIVPKDENGNPIENYYDCVLTDINGNDIKEWYAFTDYLMSFEKGESGYPEIPAEYASKQGRKVKYSQGGFSVLSDPGVTTVVVVVVGIIVIGEILIITIKVDKKHKNKKKIS